MSHDPSRFLFEDDSPFRALFDAMASLVLVVDERAVVQDVNLAAARALDPHGEVVLRRAPGDLLRCYHACEELGPCGESPACGDCVLRRSITEALQGGPSGRRPCVMRLLVGPREKETHFLVGATPLAHQGRRYALLILDDVTELHDLRQLLPICAWCRKVYVRGEYHAGLEQRLRERALVDYTHGICPDCLARHFPGEGDAGSES